MKEQLMKITADNYSDFNTLYNNIHCLCDSVSDLKDSQTLIPLELLVNWKSELYNELVNWKKEQFEKAKSLATPGKILKTVGGDGLSYCETIYYKFLRFDAEDNQIIFDKIVIGFGDYGNCALLDEKSRENLDDFAKRLNKLSHSEVDPEEFEFYRTFCNNIPKYQKN